MTEERKDGIESVEKGIEETLAKIPGGEWKSEAEHRAEIDMWLNALRRMIPEDEKE